MNNNMNDAPTKEELLAAGFKPKNHDHISEAFSFEIKKDYQILVFLIEHECGYKYFIEDYDSRIALPIPFTKQSLFDFVKLANGKELDFTLKEKTYSWDSVRSELDEEKQFYVSDFITYLNGRREKLGEQLTKKLTALVKLEYIIKAIEADDGSGFVFYVWFRNGNIHYDMKNKRVYISPIVITGKQNAQTLIKHHPDLIKSSRGGMLN